MRKKREKGGDREKENTASMDGDRTAKHCEFKKLTLRMSMNCLEPTLSAWTRKALSYVSRSLQSLTSYCWRVFWRRRWRERGGELRGTDRKQPPLPPRPAAFVEVVRVDSGFVRGLAELATPAKWPERGLLRPSGARLAAMLLVKREQPSRKRAGSGAVD